ASIVLLMSVPLLTMRLIAEERRNRTMTMLMSAPVSMTQIVLGKFLATAIFLAIGALGAFLVLWLINIAASDPASPVHLFSLLKHFEGFMNGTVGLSDLIYFAVLSAVFLVLSIRRLDAD